MTGRHKAFDVLVTVASWEPRFVLGIERTLQERSARRIILAYFVGEYGDRTEEARHALRKISKEHPGIDLREQEMTFGAPDVAWRLLEKDLGPTAGIGDAVLVDLTTMPREIIWSALFWLEAGAAKVDYVYHRPKTYASDWLSRDPNDPRLVYKLAGTLEVGRPTALVAVTGFDEKRCRQAIEFYEPARVLLAAQGGRQYENNLRNVGPNFAGGGISIDHTEVDAFGADHGVRCAPGSGGEARAGPQRYLVLLRPEAVRHGVVQTATRVFAMRAGLHRLQGIQPELLGGIGRRHQRTHFLARRRRVGARGKMVAVELCGGAGGLARGLVAAGIDIAISVEQNKYAASSYRFNFPNVDVIEDDIRKVSGSVILS